MTHATQSSSRGLKAMPLFVRRIRFGRAPSTARRWPVSRRRTSVGSVVVPLLRRSTTRPGISPAKQCNERGAVCSGHQGRGVHGFPAAPTSFAGRAGARGGGAAGAAPPGDGDRAGWFGEDPAGRGGDPAGSRRFADVAWLVELAPVHEAEQVPPVVAAVLGIRVQPGVPVAAAHLRILRQEADPPRLEECSPLAWNNRRSGREAPESAVQLPPTPDELLRLVRGAVPSIAVTARLDPDIAVMTHHGA
jgi:hypothetical protein